MASSEKFENTAQAFLHRVKIVDSFLGLFKLKFPTSDLILSHQAQFYLQLFALSLHGLTSMKSCN